jgi:energy-coupling factor transport system ATP-binding protein
LQKTAISIQDLWYAYPGADNRFALQSITLTVADGEFVALLGANGSGKSTLARMLNGLLLPARGTVSVDGLATSDEAQRQQIRRRLQMIFQNPENQAVGLTPAEDIAFGLVNIGWPRQQLAARIDWALGQVGLTEKRDRPVHALSGGEKQKLATAACLALGPRWLVLDEATAMLDPAARRHFLQTLHALRRQERLGVILITHQLEEVLGADRIVLMDGGTVRAVGPPADLLGQSQLLEQCGVELPYLPALARELREGGLDLPMCPTIDELVKTLCQ